MSVNISVDLAVIIFNHGVRDHGVFPVFLKISVGRNAGICKIAEDEKKLKKVLHMSPVGFDIEYRNCKLKIYFMTLEIKAF